MLCYFHWETSWLIALCIPCWRLGFLLSIFSILLNKTCGIRKRPRGFYAFRSLAASFQAPQCIKSIQFGCVVLLFLIIWHHEISHYDDTRWMMYSPPSLYLAVMLCSAMQCTKTTALATNPVNLLKTIRERVDRNYVSICAIIIILYL